MAKIKPKFKIGEWVQVNGLTGLKYNDDNIKEVFVKKLDPPKIGQIIGAKYRYTGEGHEASYRQSGYEYPEEDYYLPYLGITGSVLIWIIAIGYLNKPIHAVEKDIIPISEHAELPWKWVWPWTEENRKFQSDIMKEEMKNWPRNEKGQWIKQIIGGKNGTA